MSGIDDLLEPFYRAEKPRSAWCVGVEAEKFGVYADTGLALTYEGERGVKAIFNELCDRRGWSEEREYPGGEVIALRRGDSSISLEPAAQLEFSSAPYATLHGLCRAFRGHMQELQQLSNALGVVWLGLGFHPFARQTELDWVPKLRYGIMREYLPTRGARALDMMRRTATVQANFDYQNEADAIRKLRVALAIQPVVSAMFANSPFIEGRIGTRLSERAAVWLEVDPDRCGIMPFAWEEDFSYRKYVEWALDVPMFLVKRGDRVVKNTGQTFRSFIEEGFQGERATRADWAAHLGSLFPEVRLRNTIEVRGADAQSISLVCALPALWKGILYDDRALGEAERLVSGLTAQEVQRARPEIARIALRARLAGRLVLEWALQVVEIADQGLQRLRCLNSQGEDETIHLARLRRLIADARTPAEALLARFNPAIDIKNQLIEHASHPSAKIESDPWMPSDLGLDQICDCCGTAISP
ncbi:MAG: glutamate--cysteine ligase [Deltaproteobacteria bacterium]|nr:glutamate--cysteine ligase [Deltaproteobacteria bacterium]